MTALRILLLVLATAIMLALPLLFISRVERDEEAYREYLRPAHEQTLFHKGEIIQPITK